MSDRKPSHAAPLAPVSSGLLGFLAFMAGATVANLYYSQPLLAQIAARFHIAPDRAGLVAVATQIGYAAGLLIIVPLGDGRERKRLILTTTALLAGALLLVALSPDFPLLLAACLVLGFVTTVPQLLVPYTAHLALPARRGRAVGIVMSGLLIGIILSRALSGFGAFLGWRVIYALAAGAMALCAAAAAWLLPRQMPDARHPHGALLRSLVPVWRQEPALRRHAFLGAMGFAAFNTFWTPLVFHYTRLFPGDASRMVGITGFIGAAGALAAPLSGRLSDRLGARAVNGTFLALILAAFLILWLYGDSLPGIALGAALLDAGVQGSHVSNQTRIYALHPHIRNRLTALYMAAYFAGGALGSFVATSAWQEAGWTAVCACGAAFALAAQARLFMSRREPSAHGPPVRPRCR
ncbi:MFS transporter [Acidiferrobacter sp.]|uniref:MFS transporter n=1 Tax=Acidiferrobacter sp. TaxID=1872107 RepID=UPI00260EF017|nr:MFS transporter [Acidiferrobacter sp.]